jgi:hypothetical protein
MAYIAFDLDAIGNVSKVARSAQLSDAIVGWGLIQTWEWCWREKADLVTRAHLRGFFGADIADALVAFGFLDPVGEEFRVKGADRYLRIRRARAAGGHAAKTNLKRGSFPAQAGSQPGNSPASAPALTASSDERAATSEQRREESAPFFESAKTTDQNPSVRPTSPQRATEHPSSRPEADSLRDRMEAAWKAEIRAEYSWTFADDQAMRLVLQKANGDVEHVLERWRRAVRWVGFPVCHSVQDLGRHWNAYAKEQQRPPDKTASQVRL